MNYAVSSINEDDMGTDREYFSTLREACKYAASLRRWWIIRPASFYRPTVKCRGKHTAITASISSAIFKTCQGNAHNPESTALLSDIRKNMKRFKVKCSPLGL